MASTKRNNIPSTRRGVIVAPDSPRATSPDSFTASRHHHSHYHHRNLQARHTSQNPPPSRPRFTVPKAGEMFKSAAESPPSYSHRERRTPRYEDDNERHSSSYRQSSSSSSSSRRPPSDRLVQSFSGSDGEKATDVETRSGSYPSAYKSRSKENSSSSDRSLRDIRRGSKNNLPPKSAPILIPSRGHNPQPPVRGPTAKYRKRQPSIREVKNPVPPPVRRSISSSSSESD